MVTTLPPLRVDPPRVRWPRSKAQVLNVHASRLRYPQPVEGEQGNQGMLGGRAVPGWIMSHTPPLLDRQRAGAPSSYAAGVGPPAEHALISLLALNGLRVSEATGVDIEHLGLERGHRTLVITRKGGKVVTIPLSPRAARAIDLATGERAEGPLFVIEDGRVPLRDVQEAASHADPRTTMRTRSGTHKPGPARHLHRRCLHRRSSEELRRP